MVLNHHIHEKGRITAFNDSILNGGFTHEVKFTYASSGPPSSSPHQAHSPASSHLYAEGLK